MKTEEGSKVRKPVPPDGGYGWIVCIGYGICNLIVTPLMQNFGLLYSERLEKQGMTATDDGLIINVNSAFGLLLGLMNGPALRIFGYRTVAIVGALILSCGNFLTGFAETFAEYIIYYGIINSIGYNLTTNAFSLAVNSYFVKKRNMAIGIGMTVMGFGYIIFPLVISNLMSVYGVLGTGILMSGITLQIAVVAMFLQPVNLHYKKELIDGEDTEEKQVSAAATEDTSHVVEGHLVPTYLDAGSYKEPSESGSKNSLGVVTKPDSTWWSSSKGSLNSMKLQSDDAHANYREVKRTNSVAKEAGELITLLRVDEQDKTPSSTITQKEPVEDTWWDKVVKFFDLDLLTDHKYVILNIGLSVAVTGEYNFSILTPFIFLDRKIDNERSAYLMTFIGIADIFSRFVSPFIGNRTRWTARSLYMLSLLFLVISRTALIFVVSYEAHVICALFIGLAKGMRTIYMTLVLPNYVPIEKLGSASGIQAMTNGICLVLIGPLIGVVKDVTHSYNYCIIIMSMLSLFTIVLWSCENIYEKLSTKKLNKK